MSGKVHIIAMGGAVMHNLALDMASLGYFITGSDDEIYEPALSRLKNNGLLPEKFGWFPEKITKELDFIIVGMHAKKDNPELVKALDLGLLVYSYPELVRKLSENKTRVVVAGSHGKTTITSMILHACKKLNLDFDYIVGAQIAGFDRMVKLSDAPLIIIEGDEYLSSPLDARSKFLHYQPHISVLTGIAWDHINVFPTYEDYFDTFRMYLDTFSDQSTLIYFQHDNEVRRLVMEDHGNFEKISYEALQRDGRANVILYQDKQYPVSVIGDHNLSNLSAAMAVMETLGYAPEHFLHSIEDFTGASKRLQKLSDKNGRFIYLDFAHAPSKVEATTHSFSSWFPEKPTLAVFELHTFSSLDEKFMHQYKDSMNTAQKAIVYYSKHTLAMKSKPIPNENWIAQCFNHPDMIILSDVENLKSIIMSTSFRDYNILLMTSGNFDSLDLQSLQ